MPVAPPKPLVDAPAPPLSSFAERSLAVLPGGSNGEFGLPPHLTTVIASGQGCRLRDAAGREFIDFSMGWGSALVGHARPEVVAAVQAAAPSGMNFSYPSLRALQLAERLVAISPACERVRFCASGTEATMYCLRLARAATRRTHVLKFEGAYHGSNDEGVTSLFPSGHTPFPSPEPSSAGISAERTLIAPYNDAVAAIAAIARHADHLAAVIVERLRRGFPPKLGFRSGRRGACRTRRGPFGFGEVVTGFRLALAGAQQYYGVVPDLVAYGKALGGGMPIGCFGGRADIMALVEEDRIGSPDYVWTASTLGGNPVSSAAALAALDIFESPGTYPALHALGHAFREGLRKTLRDANIPGQVIGDGPLDQVVFADHPVTSYRDTLTANKPLARAVMLELFARGVFLNPMGTKLYLSLQHDHATCDEFFLRLRDALRAVRADPSHTNTSRSTPQNTQS